MLILENLTLVSQRLKLQQMTILLIPLGNPKKKLQLSSTNSESLVSFRLNRTIKLEKCKKKKKSALSSSRRGN
jgi:hypothetical protein